MNAPPVFVTCAKGISPVLAEEIRGLGLPVRKEEPLGVHTRADIRQQMRLCLRLRTAHRVLVPVFTGHVPRPTALYRILREVPWERYLGPDGYVRIIGSVRHQEIRDERYAFLKMKDAVMDRLRDVHGRRPDSGPEDHGATLYLHWRDREITVSLDLAGVPLSRRGYRLEGGAAPMQEALAAAMLWRSGWDGTAPLVTPMGGAGTLVIEAALLAGRMAPGRLRPGFSLSSFLPYPPEIWQEEVRAAEADAEPDRIPELVCTDRDPEAVSRARVNAERAGVADRIRFEVCPFQDSPVPDGAWVLLNPPYGLRLESDTDLAQLYQAIGGWLKGLQTGGMGWVITGNLKLAKRFGLKLADRGTLYNGAVECRLLGFDLHPGGGG